MNDRENTSKESVGDAKVIPGPIDLEKINVDDIEFYWEDYGKIASNHLGIYMESVGSPSPEEGSVMC